MCRLVYSERECMHTRETDSEAANVLLKYVFTRSIYLKKSFS